MCFLQENIGLHSPRLIGVGIKYESYIPYLAFVYNSGGL
ncbi:hypothetical protein THICB3560283 [Thiomonas sp. CB3]|nr:hypothetical protein THICB3560283 [Thiomonas sp. CB3]